MPKTKSAIDLYIKKFDAITKIIQTLGKEINPLIAISIVLSSKLLTPKVGKSLVKFIDAIVNPLTKYKPKNLEAASKVISAVGKMLLHISAAIAILTVLVMIDLKSTLIGAGIVVGIITILLGLSTLISLIPGKMLAKGLDGLKHVAQAAMYASLSIAVIAATMALFGLQGVLVGAGIVVGIIVVLLSIVQFITSK